MFRQLCFLFEKITKQECERYPVFLEIQDGTTPKSVRDENLSCRACRALSTASNYFFLGKNLLSTEASCSASLPVLLTASNCL